MSDHKTSYLSLLALIFILPLFFIPSAIVPLSLAKPIILYIGAFVGFVALLASVLKYGQLKLPRHKLMWAVVALPAVYALSAVVSGSSTLGLYGYNFEIGTFVSVLLASVVLLLSATTPDGISKILKIESAVFLSLGLAMIFSIIKVLSSGTLLVWGVFGNAISTPIGSWADLGISMALIAVLSLLALEMLEMTKRIRGLVYVVFVVSIALLAVINYSTAWWVALVASLIIFIYFVTMEKPQVAMSQSQPMRRISRLAVALFAVSLLFVFNPTVSPTHGSLGNTVSNIFGINTGEVSPSLASTFAVINPVLKTHLLLGSGPNTFGNDWMLSKPLAVNQSNFWNTQFNFGFGFMFTQIASVGILGTLVWLAFIVLLLILSGKVLMRMSSNTSGPMANGERFVLLSTMAGSLLLWGAMFLYVPNMYVFVLAFAFVGLFLSACSRTGVIMSSEVVFSRNAVVHFLSVFVIVFLGIGSIAVGFVIFQKSSALVYYNQAVVMANTQGTSVDDIEANLNKAIGLSPVDVYYRALADLNLSRAQTLINSTSAPSTKAQTDFQNAISKSIAAAHSATQANPVGYANWIELGSIYESLVPKPLAVTGAYDNSKTAYQTAQKLNPQSPEPSLLLARLELDNGNADVARTDIQSALALKNDYADAYFLLTQLEASANNVVDAIKSAQTASILSPDNAGIFFELGLLQYTNADYTDAVTALTKAIEITPNYANAEYFLGLSLDKLGRPEEALAQFENLLKTNPGNANITDAIANIQAGRDALYKAPSGAHPEKKATPPLGANASQ